MLRLMRSSAQRSTFFLLSHCGEGEIKGRCVILETKHPQRSWPSSWKPQSVEILPKNGSAGMAQMPFELRNGVKLAIWNKGVSSAQKHALISAFPYAFPSQKHAMPCLLFCLIHFLRSDVLFFEENLQRVQLADEHDACCIFNKLHIIFRVHQDCREEDRHCGCEDVIHQPRHDDPQVWEWMLSLVIAKQKVIVPKWDKLFTDEWPLR